MPIGIIGAQYNYRKHCEYRYWWEVKMPMVMREIFFAAVARATALPEYSRWLRVVSEALPDTSGSPELSPRAVEGRLKP